MTIGTELDQAFYNHGQRITRLEKKSESAQGIEQVTDRIAELVNHEVNERMNGDIAALESRVTDFENDMNFDPDDLRCDLESQVDDLRDCISYESDRIDDLECYKVSEEEARDIATDVCREECSDVISDFVTSAVCEEINTRAVGFTEWTVLRDRVAELEARLNKPSLGARVLRWLREGPSIKEVATGWYASIRRGS